MNWDYYCDGDGFYVDLKQSNLVGETMELLGINDTVIINYTNFGCELAITKAEVDSIVSVEFAENAKFWDASYSIFAYMNELKRVLNERGITILREYNDHTHYGLEFQVIVNSHSFDDIFSRVETIYQELEKEVNQSLARSISKLPIEIPFSLRKTKKGNCKILKVDYDCINRKYWDAPVGLEDLLEIQHSIVSLIENAHIVCYDIKFPEGMSLIYEIPMPIETTKKEAKEWIKNNIEIQLLSMLEMKFLIS